jgi:hypothetical protein
MIIENIVENPMMGTAMISMIQNSRRNRAT